MRIVALFTMLFVSRLIGQTVYTDNSGQSFAKMPQQPKPVVVKTPVAVPASQSSGGKRGREKGGKRGRGKRGRRD